MRPAATASRAISLRRRNGCSLEPSQPNCRSDRQERDLVTGFRRDCRPGIQCLVCRTLRRPGGGRRKGRAQPADVRQCVAQRSVHAEGGEHGASGGPNWNVIDIWKVAAPHIDARGARHLYRDDQRKYAKYIRDYNARPDNPLFVPENGNDVPFSRFFWLALGKGAIGWSPFGMDATGYFELPARGEAARRRDDRRVRVQVRAYRADRA